MNGFNLILKLSWIARKIDQRGLFAFGSSKHEILIKGRSRLYSESFEYDRAGTVLALARQY